MTFITTAGWVAQAVKGAVLHRVIFLSVFAANVLTARISRLTPRRAAPPR